jgi:NAD(P)H-nitrite reductase large subunit
MRTIDDAVQVQQYVRRRRCRTAVVVVGGGVLRLETARSQIQLVGHLTGFSPLIHELESAS